MRLLNLQISSGLILSCMVLATHAAKPVDGSYIGGLLGFSYQFNNTANTATPFTSEATQSGIGHDILIDAAVQVGYRFCGYYRGELQFLYNNNPYSYVRIDGVTYHNHTDSNLGYTIKGSSTEELGFANLYFDYLGDPETSVVPYVGFGVGYAYIYNANEFYLDTVYLDNSRKSYTNTALAGQAIVGLSSYIDDFFSVSIDVRYTATKANQFTTANGQTLNTSLKFIAVNFLFNGVFDFA